MARHTAGVNFRFNTNVGFVGAVRVTCCVCSFVLAMLLMKVIISINPKFNLQLRNDVPPLYLYFLFCYFF